MGRYTVYVDVKVEVFADDFKEAECKAFNSINVCGINVHTSEKEVVGVDEDE